MDAVTADKETARRSLRRLRRICTLFRCLEGLAAAALLLSWSSAHVSFDLLRRLAAVLLGPRFVFILANAIVLLLLADSSRLSPSPNSAASDGGGVLYEEILEIRRRISDSLPPPRPAPTPDEVVFEDKAVCVETRALRRSRSGRTLRRRRPRSELLRSETDVGRKKAEEETLAVEEDEVEDAEEFRRTIEAFIAKQAKFHREESMTAVVSGAELLDKRVTCSLPLHAIDALCLLQAQKLSPLSSAGRFQLLIQILRISRLTISSSHANTLIRPKKKMGKKNGSTATRAL
ncbi:hypothetical protein BHE74_00038436 [Ensete ventricosum]|nr:hypothetical protein BHE74_00038436 [Ensete ventricosum]RZR91465.1 hypothetical protein BHM03_00019583 [Ensete ventricosum]